MKAIMLTTYGPPEELELAEVDLATPKDHEIVVRVHAASVNALDWRGFEMPWTVRRLFGGGVRKPKPSKVGADVAGTVEAIGKAVTEFQHGDEVFGVSNGSFAEYTWDKASQFVLKPANVSFEAAAAVPIAALTALQALRDKGKVQAGEKVVVDGASGGVGIYAVQLAKAFGAEVTAVCSTRNVELVRSIGAGHVIDYTREDFTKTGQQFDLILAVNGHHPLRHYRRALNPKGRCVVVGGRLSQILRALLFGPLLSKLGNKKIGFMGVAKTPRADLLVLKEFLEAGSLVPVIDKCYPLDKTSEAIRHVIDEHARGKVVITAR